MSCIAAALPPILNRHFLNPISSCSKASRGLFVQLRVASIFTRLVISPSPLLRQSPYRYAIRAGRNSPDKEFRSIPSCNFLQVWTMPLSFQYLLDFNRMNFFTAIHQTSNVNYFLIRNFRFSYSHFIFGSIIIG